MNYESIRELRTVRGEQDINDMLTTGKWRIIDLVCEDECMVAFMAKVKA